VSRVPSLLHFAPFLHSLHPTQGTYGIVRTITVPTKAKTMYVETHHKASKRSSVLGMAGEKTLSTVQAMALAWAKRWRREGRRVVMMVVVGLVFVGAAAFW